MESLGNDRWSATFDVDRTGRWEYQVLCWVDHLTHWRNDFMRRVESDDIRLAAKVGQGMASLMLFTGDRLVPDEAKRIGLVELRSKKAGETATGLAAAIAGNAPEAVRLLKRTLRGGEGLDQAFDDAFGGAEFAEGLAAFRERRKPLY